MINSFVELEGMHRFEDDPLWGEILKRFRDGNPTREDIKHLNDLCFFDGDISKLPEGVRYAVFQNKDRDAINVATFEQHCLCTAVDTGNNNERYVPGAILVFSDDVQLHEGQHLSDRLCSTFWQNCGEDDISMDRGRMDPVLRLYYDCPLMLTSNEDVPGGLANGTCATLRRVRLKPGEQTQRVIMSVDSQKVVVQAARASQILNIELQHCNKRIEPQVFHLAPKQFTFSAKMPLPSILGESSNIKTSMRMKALQLPVISNTATTGHKLQGASVDNLFIHSWRYGSNNWVYVVLSRVRTMDGLFFRHELETNNTSSWEKPLGWKFFR